MGGQLDGSVDLEDGHENSTGRKAPRRRDALAESSPEAWKRARGVGRRVLVITEG